MGVHSGDTDVCSRFNGIYNGGTACCKASCGTCGGPGCERRPGGGGGCCQGVISKNRRLCGGRVKTPCNIQQFVQASKRAEYYCKRNYNGIFNGGTACCKASCGKCGGPGCEKRRGGGAGCCQGVINKSDKICGLNKAPCKLGIPTCLGYNGIFGIYNGRATCCKASCGVCGGRGCSGRPGGAAGCCKMNIQKNGRICGDNVKAPCSLK